MSNVNEALNKVDRENLIPNMLSVGRKGTENHAHFASQEDPIDQAGVAGKTLK